MSLVRENLLTILGYTPYCGNVHCKSMPRTVFNGEQFKCSTCGWQSNFETEFIVEYKSAQQNLKDVIFTTKTYSQDRSEIGVDMLEGYILTKN